MKTLDASHERWSAEPVRYSFINVERPPGARQKRIHSSHPGTTMKVVRILLTTAVCIQQAFCFHSSLSANALKEHSASASTCCYAGKNPHESDSPRRRQLLTQATGLALSTFLMKPTTLPAVAVEETKPLTFVMTGANSGIGFEACQKLSQLGHRIVLACRTKEKALDAVERLGGSTSSNLIAAECNLASLASIQAFTNELPSLLGEGSKIDRLCLNAGLCRNIDAKDCVRTSDGFELTGAYVYLEKECVHRIELLTAGFGCHDRQSVQTISDTST